MESKQTFWKKRVVRFCGIGLAVLLVLVACLPTIISKTSLRNTVVNRAINDPNLQANVGDASFGWMSSTSLQQLQLERHDERLRIDVQRVLIERSLLGLIFAAPDIGTIEIDEPLLELRLPTAEDDYKLSELKPIRENSRTTFVANIRDAGLLMHAADPDEPVVDLDGLTATLHLKQAQHGRVLVIEPMSILDHQQLTPDVCSKGLQLIAPVLADATEVSGEMSIEISEFRVPVGRDKENENTEARKISGVVALHKVQSSFTSPIAVEVTKLISGMFHKKPPETIRILDDCRVKFEIRDKSVYHEGLAFVLPEVSEEMLIRTSGTVTFDEQLDLDVEIGLPSDLTVGVPVLEKLTRKPLKLVVQGSVDHPEITLGPEQDFLGEFTARLGDEDASQEPKAVGPAIIELVSGLAEEKPQQKKPAKIEETTKDILNLIRSIKKDSQRKKRQRPK